MLAKEITYTDFNGDERTETFYFNLTKTELAELDIDAGGALVNKLTRLYHTQDVAGIAKFFKDIIVKAYGEKSDDGRFFVKGENNEVGKKFTFSPAFDKMFVDMLSDSTGEEYKSFLMGIVPKDVAEQAMANTSPKLVVGDNLDNNG